MNLKEYSCKSIDLFSVFKMLIEILFGLIIIFLIFLNSIGTCLISSDVSEKTFFLRDSVVVNVLYVIIFITLLVIFRSRILLLKNRIDNDDKLFIKCKYISLSIIFAMALLWVLVTQFVPRSDQYAIQEVVAQLTDGNTDAFKNDGYVGMYKNQVGLVLICFIGAKLFGVYNYVAFQLFNVIGIALFYKEISELIGEFGHKKYTQLCVIFSGILFFPLVMYCSFVYGNILGLLFAIFAIKHEIIYFNTLKKNNALLSLVGIMIAILFKTNYVIFFIAMVAMVILEVIRTKKIKLLIYVVLFIFIYLFQAKASIGIIKNISGEKLDQGASSFAWIAMGLHDGFIGPGWYDGYNYDTYINNGYNSDVQKKMAICDIKNSLNYYMNNKTKAARFFSRKIASQWCNPNYQCFWIAQICESKVGMCSWTKKLLEDNCTRVLSVILDRIQYIVLVGVIIYILLCHCVEKDYYSIILPIIFMGGFIFHLFWEAKAQYTISYFVLLLPLAIMGYGLLLEKIEEFKNALSKKCIIQVSFFSIAFICFVLIYGMVGISSIYCDDGQYKMYLEQSLDKE